MAKKTKKLNRKRTFSYKASSSVVKRATRRAAVALAEGRCGQAHAAIKQAVPAIGKSTRSKRGVAGGKVVRAKFQRAVAMYTAVCGRLSLAK